MYITYNYFSIFIILISCQFSSFNTDFLTFPLAGTQLKHITHKNKLKVFSFILQWLHPLICRYLLTHPCNIHQFRALQHRTGQSNNIARFYEHTATDWFSFGVFVCVLFISKTICMQTLNTLFFIPVHSVFLRDK